jgi:hypothetical protein
MIADFADILVGTPSPISSPTTTIFGLLMSSTYLILFDVDSGHGDHSGEHPLFVGCIVD